MFLHDIASSYPCSESIEMKIIEQYFKMSIFSKIYIHILYDVDLSKHIQLIIIAFKRQKHFYISLDEIIFEVC